MTTNAPAIRQKIRSSVAEQNRLYQWLLQAGPLLGYSLIKRTTQCRKGGCKCTQGEPHGPFWYLSARVNEKTVYRYLKQSDEEAIAPLCKQYKSFQRHLSELRRQQSQILALCARLRKELLKAGERQWNNRIGRRGS